MGSMDRALNLEGIAGKGGLLEENHEMLDNNAGQQNDGQQCDDEGVLWGSPIGRSPSTWAVQLLVELCCRRVSVFPSPTCWHEAVTAARGEGTSNNSWK